MSKATLDDLKTKTRRIIKPQPHEHAESPKRLADGSWVFHYNGCKHIKCPYGKVGDRLWVRETWRMFGSSDSITPPVDRSVQVSYAADNSTLWKPLPEDARIPKTSLKNISSIHMFRWASRINLEITDIRVERLQDISEEDAIAEGIKKNISGEYFCGSPHKILGTPKQHNTAIEAFQDLWESINGPGSWDANDWVWVIGYKRI